MSRPSAAVELKTLPKRGSARVSSASQAAAAFITDELNDAGAVDSYGMPADLGGGGGGGVGNVGAGAGTGDEEVDAHDVFMSVDDILKNLGELQTDSGIDDVLGDTLEDKTGAYLASIEDLKGKVQGSRIEDAVTGFVEAISDDVVMCASMGMDEVQAIENMQAQQTLDRVSKQSDVHRRRLEEITLKEIQAKTRVTARKNEVEKLRRRLEQLMILQTRRQRDVLQAAFIKAESHLRHALKRRKGEVKTYYGDLTLADSRFSGHEGRRFRVDWSYSPQPIEIKLGRLCGLRNRVPEGKYVIIASLYDKLGGHALRWHKLHGQEWKGASVPIEHDGHATSVEANIGQSLYAVCPSERELRPGMIILFEVYLLRGENSASDHAVAWGAFPIVNADFTVINGKYKMPMLRGSDQSVVSKHEDIQDLIKDDLDNWMCNMYFEVIKRPRYVGQQKEFEVELQYTSGILGYPERGNDDDDTMLDADKDNKNKGAGEASTFDGSASPSPSSTREAGTGSSAESALLAATGTIAAAAQRAEEGDVLTSSEKRRRESAIVVSSMDGTGNSDAVNEAGEVHGDGVSTLANEIRFSSSNEESGLSYIIRLDKSDQKRFTLRPGLRQRKKALTEQEIRDQYTQSLLTGSDDTEKGGKTSRTNFITRQFLAELGTQQCTTKQYWVLMGLLALSFWLRTWVHFLVQYLFLLANKIPVAEFKMEVLSVSLLYHDNLLRTGEVIAMIVLGTLGNLVVFGLMAAVTSLIKAMGIRIPQLLSLATFAYGIMTVLDPILMFVQDCIYSRWRDSATSTIGDAFKLYWHLQNSGDSGIAGVLFTVFIFLVLVIVCATGMYFYYLHTHQNGTMLSLYIRLTSEEDNFFMPADEEISHRELNELVAKSERWRGPRGERRKVIVQRYELIPAAGEAAATDTGKDKNTQGIQDVRYSVEICTIDLDGDVIPFRRFLVENGAMREVFGDITKLLKNYKEANEKE